MSLRSGVFIKYKVKFSQGAVSGGLGAALASLVGMNGDLPLKVSNDVLDGDFCVDADIVVSMHRWGAGTDCLIRLYDLPEPKTALLETAVQKPKIPALVEVSLGYFDTSTDPVFKGVFYDVAREVSGDRLLTTIKARETALFACASTSDSLMLDGPAAYGDVLTGILSSPKLPPDCVSQQPQLSSNLPTDKINKFSTSGLLLTAINDLAVRANAEFLICDGAVYFGSPIQNDAPPPNAANPTATGAGATLEYGVNLAKFDPIAKKMLNPEGTAADGSDDEIGAKGFVFTMTGDPSLRPGQKIAVNNIKDFDSPDFRIRHVRHEFNCTTGYICSGAAMAALANGALARRIDAVLDASAVSLIRELTDRVRARRTENPLIEMAVVKSAEANQTATLYYGQTAPGAETQPSIRTDVDKKETQVFAQRPMLSPFAWANCGLATPVYPGMKAVLVHNRGLDSDPLIAGYVWSQQPNFPPPPAQSSDWWLSLPVDCGAGPPDTSTKAANDLTDGSGRRVIQLKGLKIAVGADGLRKLGARPAADGADVAETCTITHASGAVIVVKKGEIDIDTGAGPKITLSSSGVTMTDGSLTMTLADGKLAIG